MKNLFKKLKSEPDEMLKQKRDTVAAGGFWVMFYLICAVIVVQSFIFENAFSRNIPLYVVLICGSFYYLWGAYKNYIPLMPSVSEKMSFFLYIVTALIFGISLGTRNVFFTYAGNLGDVSLGNKLLSVAAIAAFVGGFMLILFFIAHFMVKSYGKKQEERISQKLLEENGEE